MTMQKSIFSFPHTRDLIIAYHQFTCEYACESNVFTNLCPRYNDRHATCNVKSKKLLLKPLETRTKRRKTRENQFLQAK